MIQPGLERIRLLLKDVDFPWKAIHVAGTNGKGSICHYASSLFTRRCLRVGTFTSPHLIDRWDCIKINCLPIDERNFKMIENHFLLRNKLEHINASPFEILTATALGCFNQAKVKVGVVEVGMGGKLDATNILNNHAVSVISKIAMDHEAFLGKTLLEIASHKAGILRPYVPYVVSPENDEFVQAVIDDYAKEIGAGPKLDLDSSLLRRGLFASKAWQEHARHLRPFQRDNTVLAVVASREAVKGFRGGGLTTNLINLELVKPRSINIKGRLEHLKVIPVFGSHDVYARHIVVDGAHNVDAASVLQEWVDVNLRRIRFKGRNKTRDKTKLKKKMLKLKPRRQHFEKFQWHPAVKRGRYRKKEPEPPIRDVHSTVSRPNEGWPVTWVLAMTDGKDAKEFLRTILRRGDKVITTAFGPVDGMPWVKPMDPAALFQIAQSVQSITGFAMPKQGALRALCSAKHLTAKNMPIVLTGSLYLVGDLHRECRDVAPNNRGFWRKKEYVQERAEMRAIDLEELERVERYLKYQDVVEASAHEVITPAQEKKLLQSQLEQIQQEMELLTLEEQQGARSKANILPPLRPTLKLQWPDSDTSRGRSSTSYRPSFLQNKDGPGVATGADGALEQSNT
ncbi:folylpolyglutamate synthase [Pleosporales sp. CAS-2024a]